MLGYNGANSASCYTITATATTVTGCASTYDVSTNGSISGAATIPFNTNITGLISPTGDIDNYKFVITTGGTITITLTTLPADYDLKLLNSAGTQLAISQAGGTTSETINYTAVAGTYYAQAFGYNGANSSTVCYTLKVQLGTATKEEQGLISSTKISAFPNPVTNKVNLNIPDIKGTAALKVFDMYGKMVLQTSTSNINSEMDLSNLLSGVYMIKVINNGSERMVKVVKD